MTPRGSAQQAWVLPSSARVAVICLIVAESALFTIFVVAYLYYLGKSTAGPTPHEALTLPIFGSACLLSSSGTIAFAMRALRRGQRRSFLVAWGATVALGALFLLGTAREWARLIGELHLTPATNLFGTTYYSLVGLHALHVSAGLVLLAIVFLFAVRGAVGPRHVERVDALSLYWHFVDCVWVVVLTVVYGIGR